MKYTTNYNLKKPDGTDNYNVANDNYNMDEIDAKMKANADAAAGAQNTANGAIPKSIATAADQVLVSSAAGAWIIKTLAQFKTWLGLGSAAFTAFTAYATAAQGTTADNTSTALAAHLAESATDAHNDTNISVTDPNAHFVATDLQGVLDELFTSVSDGKTLLETAVTDMGGSVSKAGSIATFNELDSGIRGITTASIISKQEGSTTLNGVTSVNETISAVNLNNAVVFISIYNVNAGTAQRGLVKAKLTSATNLNLTKNTTTGEVRVKWVVVEFENVKSLQKGDSNITNSSAVGTDVTISAIDKNKSFAICSYKTASVGNIIGYGFVAIEIKDTTTITITPPYVAEVYDVHWQVIEFN